MIVTIVTVSEVASVTLRSKSLTYTVHNKTVLYRHTHTVQCVCTVYGAMNRAWALRSVHSSLSQFSSKSKSHQWYYDPKHSHVLDRIWCVLQKHCTHPMQKIHCCHLSSKQMFSIIIFAVMCRSDRDLFARSKNQMGIAYCRWPVLFKLSTNVYVYRCVQYTGSSCIVLRIYFKQ